MRIRHLLAALLVLLALPALAQAAPERHKLANGLTIITSENHEAPVVAFQVWVKAGSAYETKGEYGITHLIEHMIFKGTPTYPAGQMARLIEALGGEVNAYTTFDHTNYHVTASSLHAPQALAILSDAVANASFDPDELKAEKEVVVEEIRMNADDPARRRSRELQALSYGPDHPYGRPVLGSEASVRAITRQNILDYRAKWYRAPNMVVVAVGDFHTAELLPLLQRAFGGLDSRPAPEFHLPPVQAAPGPRLKIMREKVRQAALGVTWLAPGLPSDEVYPLDVAAALLSEGRTSRLYSQLKEKRGLVDAVDASNFTPQGQGLFEIEARLAPEKTSHAWPALIAETLSLASQPPSGAELKRARVGLTAEFVRSRETMSGQARLLGYFELLRGGFEKSADYLERYRQVDSSQVAQAIRANLRPENMSMVLQLPEGAEAPDLDSLSALARKAFAEAVPPAEAPEEAAAKIELNGGLTLIVKPQKAVPLVSLVLAAPGGQAAEQASLAGLSQLWARAVTRGTKERSFEQLSQELESMAGSINGFSARSTAGLTGSFLAQDWRRGIELMAEVWREPAFPPEQVERAKEEQLALLRAQEDSPVARTFKAFRHLVYGDHPYGRDPLGTPEILAALTREDLVRAMAKVQGPKGVVLSVVGAVEPEEVRVEAERLFAGLHGQVSPPPTPAPQPIVQPRHKKISDPKAKQTQIVLGFQAPSANDPRRYAMELLEALLGGQGGRLFRDLRDQRSLAYAVQPFYSASWHAGVFGMYMAVGPGKQDEALKGLAEHIELLRDGPPSEQEVARAKSYLLGREAIGLQSYAAQAMTMAVDELLGLGFDNYQHTPERVQALSAADMQQAARQVLLPTGEARLTLGP